MAANDTLFAVNTNVTIGVSALIDAGLLPPNFGNRTGAVHASSITPFGQPYLVVARRLVATDKPTAIVLESGLVSTDKLNQVGVEDTADDGDAGIFALKQQIAARLNESYATIAGAVPTASGTVTGTNGAFTEDIGPYLSSGGTGGGAVAQAKVVGFVNFKELEPNGGDDPGDGTPASAQIYPKWQGCTYALDDCPTPGQPCQLSPYTFCNESIPDPEGNPNKPPENPDPNDVHYAASDSITNCSGPKITITPIGAALTNGYTERTDHHEFGSPQCAPGDADGCDDVFTSGSVTMNNTTIASGYCTDDYWSNHTETLRKYNWKVAGVCCTFKWNNPAWVPPH